MCVYLCVCVHIALCANRTYNAHSSTTCRSQRCISGVQWLFWDILYLHFQKEAPLEDLHQSPHRTIIAHRIFFTRPLDERSISSPSNSLGWFYFRRHSFTFSTLHFTSFLRLPVKMHFSSWQSCDISPQLINVHILLFPLSWWIHFHTLFISKERLQESGKCLSKLANTVTVSRKCDRHTISTKISLCAQPLTPV